MTLKITSPQVVETLVTVNNNSPIQDYVHPDNQTQPTFEMIPGFKPFTKKNALIFKEILSTVLLTSEKGAKNFQTDAVHYPDLGGGSFHGETSGGIANVLSGYTEMGLENLCMMTSFTTTTRIQYVLSFKFKFGNPKEVLHTLQGMSHHQFCYTPLFAPVFLK